MTAAQRQARFTQMRARWLVLLKALVGAQQMRVDATGEALLSAILDIVTGHGHRLERVPSVTIPQVWQAMRDPGDELVRQCRYPSAQALRHRQRDLIDALGNLVSGVLQGLFDAETTIRVDWNAPIQSLSRRKRAVAQSNPSRELTTT